MVPVNGIGALLVPLGALALLFLAPVVTAAWLRTRALAAIDRVDADVPAIVFGFNRTIGYFPRVIWLLWLQAIITTSPWRALEILFGRTPLDVLQLEVWIPLLTPAAAVVASIAIAHKVGERVEQSTLTLSETVGATAIGQMRLLPMGCVGSAIFAATHFQIEAAVVWVCLGVLSNQLAAQLRGTVATAPVFNLQRGELFDAITGMAGYAGVRLGGIRLMQPRKSRSVNAFAMAGNYVMLTDFLLERLTKREVMFVVGHELTHLRYNHPKLGGTRAYTITVVATAALILGQLGLPLWAAGFVYIATTVIGLVWLRSETRKQEFVADAGATDLTRDPQAAITGLLKIARLNMTPLEWAKWQDPTLKHPATSARIEAIAQRWQVPPQLVSTWIQESLADKPPLEMPVEPHPNPPLAKGRESEPTHDTSLKGRESENVDVNAAEGAYEASDAQMPTDQPSDHFHVTLKSSRDRVFNASSKKNASFAIYWGRNILTPWIAVLFALAATRASAASMHWLTLAAGLGLALYLPRFAYEAIRRAVYSRWERELRKRLEASGLQVTAWQGQFVSLSAGAQLYISGGFQDWDLGFVFQFADRLTYIGEQLRFSTGREQLAFVEPVRSRWGLARWPRIRLYSPFPVDTSKFPPTPLGRTTLFTNTFSIRVAPDLAFGEAVRRGDAWASKIEQWRQGYSSIYEAPAGVPEVKPLPTMRVTNPEPRDRITPKAAGKLLLLSLTAGIGVGAFLALPVDAVAFVGLASGLGTLVNVLQFWLYTEPSPPARILPPAPVYGGVESTPR